MLQLIYKTRFWGKDLKGTIIDDSWAKNFPPCLHKELCFQCQVSFELENFTGCCDMRSRCMRLFAFEECHFLEYWSQQWDLFYFFASYESNESIDIHNLVLVPHKNVHNVNSCRLWVETYCQGSLIGSVESQDRNPHSWQFLGTCHSSVIRMEMEYHIYKLSKSSSSSHMRSSSSTSHWHLDMFMDKALDHSKRPCSRSRRNWRQVNRLIAPEMTLIDTPTINWNDYGNLIEYCSFTTDETDEGIKDDSKSKSITNESR